MVISVKNIVSEWDKGFNKPTKEATNSFSKLKGIAEKLSDDFKGISELRGKEVKSLEKTARLEVERLKRLTAELNSRKDLNEEEAILLENLNSEFKVQNDILNGAKGRLKYEEKIQKTLGYTGALFGGIQKTLEKIGIESEAFEHLNDDLREAAKSGKGLNVVGAGLKSIGHGIKESFSDPLVQVALLTEAFHELYKIGTDFNKKTFDIQKDLGLSWEASSGITHELEHMVVTSGKISDNTLRAFINFEDLVKSTKELNDYYGTSVEFSVDQLAIQAKLQEVAGLTTEEASKLDAYSASTGKNAEQLYNSIGKVNKGVFSQKKITQEVLKTSGQLAAQYKNNPDLIAKAVVQAQRLGMTLEQTKNISKNLLNFEDSISAELEAELLTGEDLNLERARGLALQGKTAEAAEELMKNLGPNGLQKFQKMLPIQQEAYAKALGMSADELGDSLLKSAKISEIEKKTGAGLSKRIKELKESGEIEKAALLEQEVLKGKSVKLSEQELDNQAEIAKNLEKAKSALEAKIAPAMGAVAKMIGNITDFLSKNKWISNVLGYVGLGAAIAAAIGAVTISFGLIKNLFSVSKLGPIGSKMNPSHVIIDGSSGIGSTGPGSSGPGSSMPGSSIPSGGSKPPVGTFPGKTTLSQFKGQYGNAKNYRMAKGLQMAETFLPMAMSMAGGSITSKGDKMMAQGKTGGQTVKTVGESMGQTGDKAFTSQLLSLGTNLLGKGANLLGKFNPMNLVASVFGKYGKGLKSVFPKLLKKLPGIGTLIEGVMAGSDIRDMMNSGKSKSEIQQAVGKRTLQGLGGILGSIGGGALVQLLNVAPGLGVALTPVASIAGDFIGRSLMGVLADQIGAQPIGEAIMNMTGSKVSPSEPATGKKPMAAGGITRGPLNALIGEAGTEAVIPLNEFYAKLKELMQPSQQPTHIYLDGMKLSAAMNVNGFKIQ